MIKAEGFSVKFSGKKDDVRVEFMTIVEQAYRGNLFDDKKDLMEAVEFAISDKDKQKDIVREMLNEILDWMKEAEEGEKK